MTPKYSIIFVLMAILLVGFPSEEVAQADRGSSAPLSAITPSSSTFLEKTILPTVQIVSTIDVGGLPMMGKGSGIILNERYILTAYHVVDNAIAIKAILQPDGTELSCTLVCHGDLGALDYAILQMHTSIESDSGAIIPGDSASEIDIAYFADVMSPESFEDLVTGQSITIVGYPLGGEIHITDGRLCAKTNGFYTSSAPVINGNSGGPVFTDNQLIGILVRVATSRGVPITHMNFFVPLDAIQADMHEAGNDFVWAGELPPEPEVTPEDDAAEDSDEPTADLDLNERGALVIGRYDTIFLLFFD